jgi:hypothetical protein
MTRITLNKYEDRRINNGRHWLFSYEIREVTGDSTAGITDGLYDATGVLLSFPESEYLKCFVLQAV